MLGLDQEISQIRERYQTLLLNTTKTRFSDYPLSQKTLKGLHDANFTKATEIQQESIRHALLGRNIVGVAETGSGKTLAFLLPVIEHLFINKYTRETGGLAALIISPTRELAYQLFETLRKIGKYHDFSAGLIIGGKNLRFERSRMDQCNILICTPGRLLQHMDENPLFDACNVEVLVLDEADRCLDMGFEQCINAILQNLPESRQTLLFSATQTSAGYVSRLKLKDAIYVGKNWLNNVTNGIAIPKHLNQNYVVVDLKDKITMLWSFIKNHLKQKIVVFLSSCKQVKYINEIFCKLRPGVSLLALYGTLNQDRRISIYNEFLKKDHGVLFATDIASRGLDFRDVNWVVQLDCPEDFVQYIHRAGRSARNKSHGESLLVLMPSEEDAMVMELKTQNINLCKIEIDTKKLFSPVAKIKALCARNPELKSSAQRAFIAYIKSIYLMKNKNVFNVNCLDFQQFAESLGLMTSPRIRFLEKQLKKYQNNINSLEFDDAYDDTFLKMKRVNHDDFDTKDTCEIDFKMKKRKTITKSSIAKKIIRKNIEVNQKLLFDEGGNELKSAGEKLQVMNCFINTNNENGLDIASAKNLLIEEDEYDKVRLKEMIKSRHRKLKEKHKKNKAINHSSDEESFTEEIDLIEIPEPNEVEKSYILEENDNKDTPNLKASTKVLLQDTEDIASQLLSYT